jgi:hypothetical protein
MSDILREQSKWARERTKTLTPYIHESKSLFSTVAGRGFKVIPGFLYDLHNSLELGVKSKLSDVNFAILSDTIERELKASGISYDLTFKTAQLAWELEKQSLMDAWGNEYALIKQAMQYGDEVVARLGIGLYLRQVYLIEQKTLIEEEAEGYRNRIAMLGVDVADAEAELAAKKVLTANKKLEIIPTLQQILAQELLLIEAELGKNNQMDDLMEELRKGSDKRRDQLLPALQRLISQLDLLGEALIEQATLQGEIAVLRKEIAEAELDNTESRRDIANARKILDDKLTANEAKKLGVEQIKRNLRFALTGMEMADSATFNSKIAGGGEKGADVEVSVSGAGLLNTWIAFEKAYMQALARIEKDADGKYLDTKSTAIDSEVDNKKSYYAEVGLSEEERIRITAENHARGEAGLIFPGGPEGALPGGAAGISASAKITSELIHLLSQ